MVSGGMWRSIVDNLDDPDTQDQAIATLRSRLSLEGDNTEAAVAAIVPQLAQMKTPRGKEFALGILRPYATNVPAVVELALELSMDQEVAVRTNAANVLFGLVENPRVRERVEEMVSDPDANIRNNVMKAVAEMDFGPAKEAGEVGFHLIQDAELRSEAISLLEELERAVKMLQDLGLDEGQNLIVNDLILPKIAQLSASLTAEVADAEEVVAERRRGILNVGTLKGSAHALALATATVANADEAAATVVKAAEGLGVVGEMLAHLL